MRSKVKRILPLAVVAAVALALTACNQDRARSDADMAARVQRNLNADTAVQNKQLQVQAASAVVTLSGTVSSDAERTAAASDAASVAGVRTVINNLTVAAPAPPPQAAAVEPPVPAPSEAAPEPATPEPQTAEPTKPQRNARREHYSRRSAKPSAASRREARQAEARTRYWESRPTSSAANHPQTVAQVQPSNAQPSYAQPAPQQQPSAPPPEAAAPPAAPQRPAPITVPSGTTLSIRLLDTLDSETANTGDTFRGSLSAPVEVDSSIVIPRDADVTGRVVDVQSAGRFKGAALLTLELTRLSYNGHTYRIQTEEWSRQIQGRGKSTAAKVGGGAALGAIIGGIAGGGKGAAIGTVVGGGAGATAQGVTHAKQITLEPETHLTFRLQRTVTVHPASASERNAGRERLE